MNEYLRKWVRLDVYMAVSLKLRRQTASSENIVLGPLPAEKEAFDKMLDEAIEATYVDLIGRKDWAQATLVYLKDKGVVQ